MLRIILFTCLLLSIFKLTSAQDLRGNISGMITDGGDRKIIDAATVKLLNATDSSLVKTSLTDKKGDFLFENIKTGKYFVEATSIGHLKTYSTVIDLKAGQHASTGLLRLQAQAKTLEAVTVSAEIKKPLIERKIDRTVLNVDAAVTNTGTSALEVLEKAPGVTVDKDGNISLKGKQGVIIMLDGKPAYLSGQELANYLKNMPSSALEQVEIMTNPSAKYDAAGNSGIINLKTKKNKSRGLNGSISSGITQSRYTKNNHSLNMNLRNGKFNLFGNGGYSYWQGFNTLEIVRNFRNVNTKELETIFDQESFNRYYSNYSNLKVGVDFYATKRTTLGAVFSGYINPGKNTTTNTTLLRDRNFAIDSIVTASNFSKRNGDNIGINLNMRHEFDTTGKEFSIDLDYLNYDQNSDQQFLNSFLNPDYSNRRPAKLLFGTLPSNIDIYSAKTDFVFPLKKDTKIEAGLKSSYVTTDNDALYQIETANGLETDEGKTNHFIYKENINAAYVNFNKQIKKLGFQLGLRLENTHAKGDQRGNSSRPDSSFTKKYTNLFPTAYLSYNLSKSHTFSLNYGKRIDRPSYQSLNPFYYFLDEYTYEVGNTLLQPQFTDNIELSHTFKGFLNTTVNYGQTDNLFTEVLKQITSERKTFLTKENIASRTNFGLAVSAQFPIAKFWSTNIYSNVVHDHYKGALNNSYLDVTNVTFLGNVNNQFTFKKGWKGEVSGFYRSKGVEGQMVANPMWRIDAGIAKQILQNKGSLKLSIRDIFQSQQFSGYVSYEDIDVKIKNRRDSRAVSLAFTYGFGKPIKGARQRKTGGASDEQSRVKTGD